MVFFPDSPDDFVLNIARFLNVKRVVRPNIVSIAKSAPNQSGSNYRVSFSGFMAY